MIGFHMYLRDCGKNALRVTVNILFRKSSNDRKESQWSEGVQFDAAPKIVGVARYRSADRVHAILLRMVRSDPDTAARELDVVVNRGSVCVKHGGDLTGPDPNANRAVDL